MKIFTKLNALACFCTIGLWSSQGFASLSDSEDESAAGVTPTAPSAHTATQPQKTNATFLDVTATSGPDAELLARNLEEGVTVLDQLKHVNHEFHTAWLERTLPGRINGYQAPSRGNDPHNIQKSLAFRQVAATNYLMSFCEDNGNSQQQLSPLETSVRKDIDAIDVGSVGDPREISTVRMQRLFYGCGRNYFADVYEARFSERSPQRDSWSRPTTRSPQRTLADALHFSILDDYNRLSAEDTQSEVSTGAAGASTSAATHRSYVGPCTVVGCIESLRDVLKASHRRHERINTVRTLKELIDKAQKAHTGLNALGAANPPQTDADISPLLSSLSALELGIDLDQVKAALTKKLSLNKMRGGSILETQTAKDFLATYDKIRSDANVVDSEMARQLAELGYARMQMESGQKPGDLLSLQRTPGGKAVLSVVRELATSAAGAAASSVSVDEKVNQITMRIKETLKRVDEEVDSALNSINPLITQKRESLNKQLQGVTRELKELRVSIMDREQDLLTTLVPYLSEASQS